MLRVFILISIILTHYINNVFAQKEANIWYFGYNSGIDFNSGSPVALADGQLNTREGCASISDENGNLLFYSDGVTVWNKNHQIMLNGTGLLGHASSTQSAIIVPKPNSNTIYYIFTVDAENISGYGLHYSEIDMSLAGGLGAVNSNKNIQLVTPTCEKLTAVKHSNDRDIWVITHRWESDAFYAYLVTPSGVTTSPVITNIGMSIGGNVINTHGYLKASPNGKFLALAHGGDISSAYLYDFNTSNGIISNERLLSNPPAPYGVEFSASSNALYIADGSSILSNIYQYNLDATNIAQSEIIIETKNYPFGALQLGPDKKIYIVNYETNYLSAIAFPDVIGTGANYIEIAVELLQIAIIGLPPFIQSYFISEFSYKYTCLGDITEFKCDLQPTSYDSLRWNFGDASSGFLNNTSTLVNPTHSFTDTGSYSVRLIVFKNNFSDTVIKNIKISKTNINLGKDTTLCIGNTLTLTALQPDVIYEWKDGSTNPTLNVTQTGQYWVKVTANGCIVKDTIQITFIPPSIKNISAQICEGKNYTLPKGRIVTTSGVYRDTLLNSVACDSIIIVNLTVNPAPVTNNSKTICAGNSYTLPNGRIVFTSGIYRDTLQTIVSGCDSIIVTNLTVSNPPIVEKTAHICEGNFYTLPTGKNVNNSGSYRDTIKTANNCDSIIITNLIVHTVNTTQQNIELCAGEVYTLPSGINVSTAGNYTSILKTFYNCDSIIRTQLSVITAKRTQTDTLVCDANSYMLPSGKIATQSGTYTDSIRTNSGCDSIITVHLQMNKKPQIELPTSVILCIDSSLVLRATITGSSNYFWQDNSTLPDFTVTQAGIYILTAANICGETRHTTTITTEDCSNCDVYLPTAFSPNNDGINDLFFPFTNCALEWIELKIFNRWGELLFSTNSITTGWNGMYKNELQPLDSYLFILNYKQSKKEVINKKGSFILLR